MRRCKLARNPNLNRDDTFPNPHKLDVNLVLPGDGSVWLSDLRLEEMEPTAIAAVGQPGNLSGLMNGLIVAVTSMIGILVVAIIVSVTIFYWYRRRQSMQQDHRKMQALDLH